MQSHPWAMRGYCCLALLLAASLCADAVAQETIEILSPSNNADVPTNFLQQVTIQWLDGDDPIRGDVTLTTSLGGILDATVRTDDFGHATFIITSIEEGHATLEVTAGGVSDTITVEFDTPTPGSDLADLIAVQPPFGENGVLRRTDHRTRLWLAKDRIGFLAGDSFQMSDLDDFNSTNNVIEVIVLSERMFALRFDDDTRVTPLRDLARELESIGGFALTEFNRPIRKAGLVAWLDGTNQPYIVPDTIIVKFVAVPNAAVQTLFKNEYELSSLEQLGRNPRRFVARIAATQMKDPIQLAREIGANPLIELSDPNFVVPRSRRSAVDTTPGFNLQWYHENTGDYAQEDADIDSERAWEFTEGSHDVMIAVLDSGFDIFHPDLIDNLDPVDPTNFAADLFDNDNSDLLGNSFGMETFGHGTRAAGVAAARGDNNKGYAGVCPLCQLFLVRMIPDDKGAIKAIDEAVLKGAKVLSNSWGWPAPSPNLKDALTQAHADGVVVFMAMSNNEIDNCGDVGPLDTSSPHAVIAVSGITDYDMRSPYDWEGKGYGKCMDILAPTRGGEKGIHTTSVEMTTTGKLSTYWHDFSGTSASTPMAAGVAGLLLTLDGTLTPLQIQRVLQDTADRVDPANASYSAESGFGDPDGIPKHGYGRINAFEAARLVASQLAVGDVPPGRGGKDLLLRDHAFDWGNSEQPSSTLFNSPRGQYAANKSVDIKIDVDPFEPTITTASEFAELNSEQPEVGKPARIYVRTRNRGPNTVSAPKLKLHVTVVDGAIPDLPADFWSSFPSDSSTTDVWLPLGMKELEDVDYSGASLAGCPERVVPRCHPWAGFPALKPDDLAVIEFFELPARDWDIDSGQYLALLAAIDSGDDPLQAKLAPSATFNDVMTAVHMDNNVTLWVSKVPENGGGGFNVPDAWLILLLVLAIAMSI